jgi:hypothetical protein
MPPISGTIPFFSYGNVAPDTPTVVTVTGVVADGQADGTQGTETLAAAFRRFTIGLSVSGILSGTAQAITPAELSGIMQIQRECAMRAADLESKAGKSTSSRLALAQAILAVSGEVQFGS